MLYTSLLIAGVLFLSLLNPSFEQLCHFHEDTTFHGLVMDCSDLKLTSVPRNIPNNTTTLNLRNNSIAEIEENAFAVATELRQLNLHKNRINRLHSKSFTGLENLQHLNLASNKLVYDYDLFPKDVFIPLRSLEILDLSDNRIDTPRPYPDISFQSLSNLRTLYLDGFHNITLGQGFAGLSNLQFLQFYRKKCRLTIIENNTFHYLQNAPLSVLDFENCPLHRIETGAFVSLKKLSVLNMKWAKQLTIKDALTSLYGLQGHRMNLIDFTRVFNSRTDSYKTYGSTSLITKDDAKYLVKICVKKLILRHNKIFYADMSALREPPFANCIEELDISHNLLNGYYFDYLDWRDFTHLKHLDISFQSKFINLPVDDLMSPTRISKNVMFVYMPPLLEYLDMAGVIRHGIMSSITVINGSNIEYLNISFDGIYKIECCLSGIPNLEVLDISQNHVTVLPVEFLHKFPNLVHVFMNNMGFDGNFFYNNAKTIFSRTTSLETISLADNKLTALPPDIFEGLSKLTFLDLSHNYFVSIPINDFTLQNLLSLGFSYNSLTHLSSEYLKTVDSIINRENFSLTLQGNPLSCACSSLDFISWIVTTNSKLDKGGDYNCMATDASMTTTKTVSRDYYAHWMSCISQSILTVAVFLFCMIIIGLLCVFLVLNNWSKIQHRLLRWLDSPYRLPRRSDFRFVLYIGYSDADYQFVYTTVYEQLETQGGLQLFLQEREVMPGHDVLGGIVDGINTSWRTLLVVTREFLQDSMTFFKIRLSLFAVSEAMPRRVILLIVGNNTLRDVPPEILSVVHEDDIYTIPGIEYSEPVLNNIRENIINDPRF